MQAESVSTCTADGFGLPPWSPPVPEPIALVDHNPLGVTSATLEVFHYVHDALGSVVGLTDENGALVERFTLDVPAAKRHRSSCDRQAVPDPRQGYTYDPYGKVFIERWDPEADEGNGAYVPVVEQHASGGNTVSSGLAYSHYGNPFLWTGQRYDAAVGLFSFKFRTYSPTLGRWLQRDPLGYVDGTNLYEYVQGAPLYWVDPFGLCTPSSSGAGGAGAIAAAAERALKALKRLKQAAKNARVTRAAKNVDHETIRKAEQELEQARQLARDRIKDIENITEFENKAGEKAKGLWDRYREAEKHVGDTNDVVKRLVRDAKEAAKDAGSRESGRHGEQLKRAAEELNRKAKEFDRDDPVRDALTKAADRLHKQGRGIDHPGGPRGPRQ